MKVTGTGELSQAGTAEPSRAAGGGDGFRIVGAQGASAATQASAVSNIGGVMGVASLLALQNIETPTERRRRSVKRAGRLLDELDEIKIALLGGEL